jgi:hypothetical protein
MFIAFGLRKTCFELERLRFIVIDKSITFDWIFQSKGNVE